MTKPLKPQVDIIENTPTKKPYKQADKNYKRFAKHLVNSGNITKAYQATYPDANASTARKRGSELIKQEPRVFNAVVNALEAKGIKPSWIATQIKTLAKANRHMKYNEEGKLIQVSDNTVRLEAVKTALKVCGYLQSGIQIDIDNRQVSIGGEILDHRQLKTLTNKLSAMHRSRRNEEQQDGNVYAEDADFTARDDAASITDEEALRELAGNEGEEGSDSDEDGCDVLSASDEG